MENQIHDDNEAMDFNSPISEDGNDFVLLPDGDYPFRVKEMSKERYEGSEKMPACWKAAVKIEVDGGAQGRTTMTENLFLTRKTEWKIGQFFVSIGHKPKGSKNFVPDWNNIIGETGMLRLAHHTYKSKNSGEDVTSNNVKAFLEPAEGATAPAPQPTQQPAFDPSKGF